MHKLLKCHFKNNPEVDISKFSNASCLLTISVGQGYHENEMFSSAIDLIKLSFKSCTIMLYDTVQRYTMALGGNMDPNSYYALSLSEGDLWLERNRKYYNKLEHLDEIIRWDRWLSHPQFLEKKALVQQSLMHDIDCKRAFEQTIFDYLSRYKRRLQHPESFDYDRAEGLCYDYLIEECAAFCLWPETGCDYDVYPSKRNPAMDIIHRRLVLPNHPNRLYSLALKFKDKIRHKPQKFNTITLVDSSELIETNGG